MVTFGIARGLAFGVVCVRLYELDQIRSSMRRARDGFSRNISPLLVGLVPAHQVLSPSGTYH